MNYKLSEKVRACRADHSAIGMVRMTEETMARRPVLETAVMDLLWDRDAWLTTNEVRTALGQTVAPTTIGTVLARLHNKGRVERRARGRGFEYRGVGTREEYVASRMEEALKISSDRRLALLEFIDRLPPDDRSRLRRILGS